MTIEYVGNGTPMVTRRSESTTAQVAVTVASVGPYTLRKRRPGRCHRVTRSFGQDSPETSRKRSREELAQVSPEQHGTRWLRY